MKSHITCLQLRCSVIVVVATSFVVTLSSILGAASGLTCLTCSQTPIPRECKHVVHCSTGEACYMEKTVYPDGNVYYDLGCRDKKLCTDTGPLMPNIGKRSTNKTCDKCCDDRNLCNSFGCDALDYPSKSKRGPICYNCHTMSTDTACNNIETCGRDEECMIHSSPSNVNGEVYYTASCGRTVICNAFSLIGKKRGILCHRCCKDDLCNLGGC